MRSKLLTNTKKASHARPPIHPGVILKSELMEPYDLSANRLAHFLGVPQNRITAIINGKRGISADTAIRLSKCFGMSAEMWINLQADYELRRARFNGLAEIAERDVRVFAEVS